MHQSFLTCDPLIEGIPCLGWISPRCGLFPSRQFFENVINVICQWAYKRHLNKFLFPSLYYPTLSAIAFCMKVIEANSQMTVNYIEGTLAKLLQVWLVPQVPRKN